MGDDSEWDDTNNAGVSSVRVSGSLWQDRVEYIDLGATNLEVSPTARTLPLFLLGSAFYPQGETYLNVFEMKYRTMMFDCAKSDDMFGYIHTNSRTGQIASIGTLCKITDRQLLPDGRQYISVEGVGRFRVRKILKTLPYISAEIDTNVLDDQSKDATAEAALIKLESEVYDSLKYYMRLMKTYEPNKGMVMSKACKRYRPTSKMVDLSKPTLEESVRRTSFSFSLANMIQMTQATESQLMLQTTSVQKRLEAEKVILQQASELISEQLIKMSVLSADQRDGIKMRSFNEPADDDILPSDMEDALPDKDDDMDVMQ